MLISAIIAVFSIVFPIILALNGESASKSRPFSEYSSQNGAESEKNDANFPNITENDANSGKSGDKTVTVRLFCGGKISEINLQDYLTGVIAAEMPASFNDEALKAQAVAARTYTAYKMLNGPESRHPDADVCSDITCCKAYIDDSTMRENWGNDYEKNLSKIENAVKSTDGICMTYDDEPILAVFHSSSGKMTEESGSVWGQELPYLKSVESPESDETVPNYNFTIKVSFSDFTETVKKEYPETVFGDDSSAWITDITHTESGRIDEIKAGGVTISGTELRAMFDLRSTYIDISTGENEIIFTTTGYGHGVGMSQYGANILAEEGADYREILSWYYTGIDFGSIGDYID